MVPVSRTVSSRSLVMELVDGEDLSVRLARGTQTRIEVDRPFPFLIRDRPTGTILFLGPVLDPTG